MQDLKPMNRDQRSGAVLPLVALILPILLLLAGIAINIAYMQLTATELQIATDVAAKAAGGTFTRTLDKDLALASASEAGELNTVAGAEQKFDEQDLVVGSSTLDPSTLAYRFDAGEGNNAIQLSGRRDGGSLNGKIGMFFPSLMGVDAFALKTESVSTRIDVDLVLVIDRSGSMAYNESEDAVYPPNPAYAPAGWQFGDPVPPSSRWEAAYDGVSEFLKELEISALNEQVALVTYSNDAYVDQPLTQQFSNILSNLDWHSNNFEGGGTNISDGIDKASEALVGPDVRQFAARVIVLLTDGKVTVGDNPTDKVSQLAKQGVMTVTISFSDEADTGLMKELAAKGQGIHIHAQTRDDLKNAFRAVVRSLPTILTQ